MTEVLGIYIPAILLIAISDILYSQSDEIRAVRGAGRVAGVRIPMRIEPLEESQMSWMLKPFTWMMKRQVGKVLNPYKAWAYRPGITLHDVDLPAIDRELESHPAEP